MSRIKQNDSMSDEKPEIEVPTKEQFDTPVSS